MTKFKFGDKVWHDEYGLGFIIQLHGFEIDLTYSVMFEDMVISGKNIKLTKVSDWIPCSERMPEFGQSVTVYDGDRMWTDTTYDFGDGLCFYYDDDGRATHWMPLPAPPQD